MKLFVRSFTSLMLVFGILSCSSQSVGDNGDEFSKDLLYPYMKESADAILALKDILQESRVSMMQNKECRLYDLIQKCKLSNSIANFQLLGNSCSLLILPKWDSSAKKNNRIRIGDCRISGKNECVLSSMFRELEGLKVQTEVALNYNINTSSNYQDQIGDELLIITSRIEFEDIDSSITLISKVPPPDWLWLWDYRNKQNLLACIYPQLPNKLNISKDEITSGYNKEFENSMGNYAHNISIWRVFLAEQVNQYYERNIEAIEYWYEMLELGSDMDEIKSDMKAKGKIDCSMFKNSIDISFGCSSDKLRASYLGSDFIERRVAFGKFNYNLGVVKMSAIYQNSINKNMVLFTGGYFKSSNKDIEKNNYEISRLGFSVLVDINSLPSR